MLDPNVVRPCTIHALGGDLHVAPTANPQRVRLTISPDEAFPVSVWLLPEHVATLAAALTSSAGIDDAA